MSTCLESVIPWSPTTEVIAPSPTIFAPSDCATCAARNDLCHHELLGQIEELARGERAADEPAMALGPVRAAHPRDLRDHLRGYAPHDMFEHAFREQLQKRYLRAASLAPRTGCMRKANSPKRVSFRNSGTATELLGKTRARVATPGAIRWQSPNYSLLYSTRLGESRQRAKYGSAVCGLRFLTLRGTEKAGWRVYR